MIQWPSPLLRQHNKKNNQTGKNNLEYWFHFSLNIAKETKETALLERLRVTTAPDGNRPLGYNTTMQRSNYMKDEYIYTYKNSYTPSGRKNVLGLHLGRIAAP